MYERNYNISGRWPGSQYILTAVVIIAIVAGCAHGANYGSLESSRDLNNQFLRYEVLPDHKYYTFGSYDAPAAILAIHNDYQLDYRESFWVPIPNVDTAQIQKWIVTISPDQTSSGWGYFAAYILNPEGGRIGAWFSNQSLTTIKFHEGNKVQVWPPDPEPNLNFRVPRLKL